MPGHVDLAATGHAETAHLTVPYVSGGDVTFACNLDVLSLMLREGYARDRCGNVCCARLLLAILDGYVADVRSRAATPPFMLRVVAESAWELVRAARKQAAAPPPARDVVMKERARAMDLLDPHCLAELRHDVDTLIKLSQ